MNETPIPTDERHLAYTTAQLLHAVLGWRWLNLLLLAAALWCKPKPDKLMWLTTVVALGIGAQWLYLRLGFDARHLAGFSDGQQPPGHWMTLSPPWVCGANQRRAAWPSVAVAR